MDRPKKEKRSQKQVYILRSKSSPLSFEEHLVYSCLVYRARYKAPATKTEIGRLSKLKRGTTVKKAIDRLESLGLAKCIGGKWIGLEPTEGKRDWFLWQPKKSVEWTQDFAFVMCLELLPEFSRVLSPRENVLVWILYDSKWRGKNISFLSRMLGSDPKTVGRLLKSLMAKKIIDANRNLMTKRYWIIPKGETPASVPASTPVAVAAPETVKPLSIAERVKAEGEALAAKMRADLKAQAEQIEAELSANQFVEPQQIEGLVASKSVEPSVQKQTENESKPKLYNGWATSDGFDEERNQTPEERAKAASAIRDEWIQQEYQILNKLWNSWKIPFDDQKEIIDLLWDIWRETGEDAIEETLLSGSLYRFSEKFWGKSKAEAKSNPRKYFKVSLINEIKQAYGCGKVGAA